MPESLHVQSLDRTLANDKTFQGVLAEGRRVASAAARAKSPVAERPKGMTSRLKGISTKWPNISELRKMKESEEALDDPAVKQRAGPPSTEAAGEKPIPAAKSALVGLSTPEASISSGGGSVPSPPTPERALGEKTTTIISPAPPDQDPALQA